MDEKQDDTSEAPPTTRLSRLSRSVAGHVVLVTGAGSGIGRATAHLFADEGAVVAVTDRDAGRVATVVAEIEGVGGGTRGWTLDVADPAAIETVVAEVAEWGGGLDVLVNNAGVSIAAPIDGPGYEDAWLVSMDVMLTAQARTIRAALPHLRAASSTSRPRRAPGARPGSLRTRRPSTGWSA